MRFFKNAEHNFNGKFLKRQSSSLCLMTCFTKNFKNTYIYKNHHDNPVSKTAAQHFQLNDHIFSTFLKIRNFLCKFSLAHAQFLFKTLTFNRECNKHTNGNNIHGEIVDDTWWSLAGAFLFMSFANKLPNGAALTNAEKEGNI